MSNNPQAAITHYESELRFQTLFDSAAEFIFVIDPDGYILLTNRYVSVQSAYTPEELKGKHLKELFTEPSRQLCDCNFPELRTNGHSRAEVEFVCKDGRILQMECSATAIPDNRGQFASFLIIQRDVTDRKRAATELADSERKFRAIFNSTFQFIGLLNPDGILLEANKTALDAAGITNKEVVGKPFWDTAWLSGLPEEQERLKAAVKRASQGELVRYETRYTCHDGKIHYVDFSLKPVRNEQGETVLIIPEGRDITERRMNEEAVCQHQRESAHLMRLSIMGEMAASMAHEINQPLTALISYCGTAVSLLQDDPSVPEGLLDILAKANQQAHRASEIIHHIRNFVSKESTSKAPVAIDQTILEMSKLIAWEQGDNHVDIDLDLGSQGCQVNANRVQLEQVLLNLVRNSVEAIQSSGTSNGLITLQTRVKDGLSIILTVKDNGPGVDPVIKDRLFEPFQTIKENGMGMGLSISRSIIKAHQGKIWLEKSEPQYTAFCIELPLQRGSHD